MQIEQIHHRFIKNSWTLSLAESCTGGAIASRLVSLPDSSFYFEGGIIAYSNHAKEKLLYVNSHSLETDGAVSEQVALEMAQGALNVFESGFALSTTGIAGPSGGTPKKPVGTVCFAIVSNQKAPLVWTSFFQLERTAVVEQAVKEALQNLWYYTQNGL